MGARQGNTFIASSGQLGAGLALVSTLDFAANSVTFSGLSGNYRYLVFLEINHTGAAGTMEIQINGDTTANHYNIQAIIADGAVISSGNSNTNIFGATNTGEGDYLILGEITRSGTGYAMWNARGTGPATIGIACYDCKGGKTDATVTEVTSLKFIDNAGTCAGSARLYRMSVL